MTHRAHSCKMPPPDPRLFDVNFKCRPAGALRHCLRKRFVPIGGGRNKTIPDASLAWHVFGLVVPGGLARGQSRRAGGPASHSERPRISPDGSGKVPLSRGKINISAVGRTRSDRNFSCLSVSEFEKFQRPDRREEVVAGLRPDRREEGVLGLRRADRRPAVSSQGPLAGHSVWPWQTGASEPTRFWPGMCTGASASACPSCLRGGRGGRGTGTRQRPPLRSLNETPRPGGRSTAPTQPSMSPTAPSGCLRGRPQRPWARIRRRQPIRRRRFVSPRPTLVPY